ncbi:MAG: DUF2490 domain-containing protein [Flavobacteriaceae bacterium]
MNIGKIKMMAVVCCFWIAYNSYAQENYFGSIQINKEITDSPKWSTSVVVHWKQFYSETGWNRIGVDGAVKRKLNNWSILGGLVTNLTFDETIENNTEIRPWLAIGLHNIVYKKFSLDQSLKLEWRNLFFSGNITNITTTRTRYKIKPNYEFKKNWSAFTSYEWYFLPNTDIGNRFVSSREWRLGVTKKYSKFSAQLQYVRERFFNEWQLNQLNGNTLSLTFLF